MTLSYQHSVNLQAFNSLAIPATSTTLVAVESIDDLVVALKYARDQNLPILVLGEGSNIVLAGDFNGLAILNRLRGIDILDQDSCSVTLKVAAGENWHQFVTHTIEHQWYGLENLALIPGLVGAAPIQNIGAYGVEVKDSIREVEFLDCETGVLSLLRNEQCNFSYRDSVFKQSLKDKVVITAVTFRLACNAQCNISYPALAEKFSSAPSLNQVFDAVCQIRSSKLPSPERIPNAGSFFKNPIVNQAQHAALKSDHPALVSFKVDEGYKLAAGWLIEQAGWKNKSIAGVCVHSEQALVLVNPQHRSGHEVLQFANAVQKDIKNRYGVDLDIEPNVV